MAAVTVEFAALLDRIVIPKKKEISQTTDFFKYLLPGSYPGSQNIHLNQLFDNVLSEIHFFTTYQLLSFEFQPENKEKI